MPEHLDAITTVSRDMFYCILASKPPSYSEMHATVATGENFEVFRDTFLTLLQRGLIN